MLTFEEISFVLVTGTSVIVILVIAFIASLVGCRRRIRKVREYMKGGSFAKQQF